METISVLKAVIALVFVLGLIGLSALALRKLVMERSFASKGKPRRLKIEETLYVDAKRKIILIKKDDEEVMVLISPNSETIIPTGSSPLPAHKANRPKTSK